VHQSQVILKSHNLSPEIRPSTTTAKSIPTTTANSTKSTATNTATLVPEPDSITESSTESIESFDSLPESTTENSPVTPSSCTASYAGPSSPLFLHATSSPSLVALFEEGYAVDPFPDHVVDLLRQGASLANDISMAQCSVGSEDRLQYYGRLYFHNHDPLRLELLRRHHDLPSAGHPGRAKTLELLCRRYYWPGIRRYVDRYVRNCHIFQRARTSRHAPFGVLKPPPIPNRPWRSIAMYFVTGLPPVEGLDVIWVVVDRLTKQLHLVACMSTVDAEDLADLFLNHVWKLHGLPDDIVSDRSPQFASRFWARLCDHLRISPKLSSAFHPQTDGQKERVKGIMEQYLRAYTTYQQENWPTLLPLAEFASNNHPSETTGLSPFFANYGFDPRIYFDLEGPTDPNPGELHARATATHLSELHEFLRAEFLRSQHRYQEGADSRRTPAPRFEVCDTVWLRASNIRSERPSRKLNHRRLGPFPFKRFISSHAYELELPRTMRIHPVFSVALLDPVATDPLPGQHNPPPPPVIVDHAVEYEI
jgi:Integrase zinc binding domain